MITDIVQGRLDNQRLASTAYRDPADVVGWFGAMQAQDYSAAKWAIALRTNGLTDSDVELAFNDGKILRTHIMRPTWHFVRAEDIRWLLALTAPRLRRINGYYFRHSGLDRSIFQQSSGIIRNILAGGKALTREEIGRVLENHGIPVNSLGLSFIMMQAELDGIVCSGPRQAKKFTYMLLDERAPQAKAISRDEALAKLAVLYFRSHGPAQIKDFAWWSGLTMADAIKGIGISAPAIRKQEKNGIAYWRAQQAPVISNSRGVFLIPAFDEYFIAYKDRGNILDERYAKELNSGGGMINGAVLIDGKMGGVWKRTIGKNNVTIKVRLFEELNGREMQALERQAKRYGQFAGMPVVLERTS